VCTRSTNSNETVHAWEDLIHRDAFDPTVVFSDIFPANEEALAKRLPNASGRLGIFHWMHRITKYLRKGHPSFMKACSVLSQLTFQFDTDDIRLLKLALEDGSLNGKTYVPDEISDLEDSGELLRSWRRYIDSKTSPEKLIDLDLKAWENTWIDKEDDEGVRLGYSGAKQAVAEALQNIKYIIDLQSHTVPVRKKPGEKHSLTQKKRSRGEKVEIVHNVLGDFANGGMRPDGAQALTMEGLVRFLMDRQQECDYNAGLTDEHTVPHYRPWLKEEANQLAKAAGLSLPYPELVDLAKDNGERFLYEYYCAQLEREKEPGFIAALVESKRTGKPILRCPCMKCTERCAVCQCHSCQRWRGEDSNQGASPLSPPSATSIPTPTTPISSPATAQTPPPSLPVPPINMGVPANNEAAVLAEEPKSKKLKLDKRNVRGCTCNADQRRTAKVQALRNGLAPDKEIQAAKRAKLIHSRGPPEFPSEPTCNIVTMREQETFTRKQAKAAAAIREATTVPGEY